MSSTELAHCAPCRGMTLHNVVRKGNMKRLWCVACGALNEQPLTRQGRPAPRPPRLTLHRRGKR